jgi:EAL domain-containing protein (putative c-di-GMP-specific phosphodiesterase class I)
MFIVNSNCEVKLMETLQNTQLFSDHYSGLYFHFSKLQDTYRNDFQLNVAINIFFDKFKDDPGAIFVFRDGDVIIIVNTNNNRELNKAIVEMRQLFAGDPLAYHNKDTENNAFADIYGLAFLSSQSEAFKNVCIQKVSDLQNKVYADKPAPKLDDVKPMTPLQLSNIEKDLQNIDLTHFIRNQTVCSAKTSVDQPRKIFEEIYVSIAHLNQALCPGYSLTSDHGLFTYITRLLDKKVLQLIKSRPQLYFKFPISINMNMSSIFSHDFEELDASITQKIKNSIVVEIHVSDMFFNMQQFANVRDKLQKLGYRVCIDGLSYLSFVQLDRKDLGADLVKIQWHEDIVMGTDEEKRKKMFASVEAATPGRIIICRCDTKSALEYGQPLGIHLYQGWYLDKLFNPKSRIIN